MKQNNLSNLIYINNTKKMTISNSEREFAFIYFKVAHTGENAIFEIPTYISTKHFIKFAKGNAYDSF